MIDNSTFAVLTARIPYLAILDSSQRETVRQVAALHSFPANTIIFLEGDMEQGLWIIEEGQVKISRLSPEGNEYILHLLAKGDSFNDIAALEQGAAPATATTLTESRCCQIPGAAIQQLLATQPAAAQAAIQMLSARVRQLVQQLENLALYSVTTRLARFLLHQAENPSPDEGVTRVAIAAHLATTPETISRALRSLESAGAINFNRHQIEIVQAEILRALAMIDAT